MSAMKITTLVENSLAEGHADLTAEFGLSLCIEHAGRCILFDTGAAGVAMRNAERLGIDLARVDAVVLSHHHFDHGGGLPAFFAVNGHAKVFLRHPPEGREYFRALLVVSRYIGLEEGLLERHKDRFVFVDHASEVLPEAHVLTEIVRRHELPKGDRYLYLRQQDGYVRDPFAHELVFVLRDEDGLVVFTGCGHSGVLNMVETVLQHFPGEHIKGVVGGFHLIGFPTLDTMASSHDEMVDLARAMAQLPVDRYWTGHCTGHKAFAILKQVLGDKLGEFHTGTTITV
jgi:7,8-dihydropterin-6-yl-methyl-4-(beta-D-ribofuranosyl)aminobenzene 5'-phosphate synthase